MGITIFYSAILMVCIFLADIAYSLLDPRVKTSRRRERIYE
jgi:ABC-type dipeptide/oligopeptide/nickel transport system permease component